jgi:hypothetical protein
MPIHTQDFAGRFLVLIVTSWPEETTISPMSHVGFVKGTVAVRRL